jgi:hypothetical protein
MPETEDQKPLPCADKLVFDTQAAAQANATTAQWQHGTKPEVRPYRCRYCHLWHLASKYTD